MNNLISYSSSGFSLVSHFAPPLVNSLMKFATIQTRSFNSKSHFNAYNIMNKSPSYVQHQRRHYSNQSNGGNNHIPFGTILATYATFQLAPFAYWYVGIVSDEYKRQKNRKLSLALEKAIQEDNVEDVAKCLAKGANVDWSCSIPNNIDNRDHLPLFQQACMRGNIKIIELMLKEKPSLNGVDPAEIAYSDPSCDPLDMVHLRSFHKKSISIVELIAKYHYSDKNASEVIRLLIQHGAQPSKNCFRYAVDKGDIELGKICIKTASEEDKNDVFNQFLFNDLNKLVKNK